MQVLFGAFLLVYIADLDPYLGYFPMRNEYEDDTAYGELRGGEQFVRRDEPI
ncbi:hypothetical protein OROGR_017772 [Orobanche gracilis]